MNFKMQNYYILLLVYFYCNSALIIIKIQSRLCFDINDKFNTKFKCKYRGMND